MKCERTDRVAFSVAGEPAPAGSKNAFRHRITGRIVVTDASGKRGKDWRKSVAVAAREAMGAREVLTPPIGFTMIFRMERPKSHFTPKGALRRGAPVVPIVRPDVTKLVRAVEDAMTGIVWGDDAHVVEQWVYRIYAHPEEEPGVQVTAYHLDIRQADGIAWEEA